MKKKSFIRVLGMMLLLMMYSVVLSAQPRAIISDHLDPAVLVNPGDTIKAEVLNYLNDQGRDALKSRGFIYVKNGGSIYVDMRRLSQFVRWEYQEDSPIVKIDPVLDPRSTTIKNLYYIDKSGNEQELQLVVIPYNVPMLHSKGAVYELDPRSVATLPASFTKLRMAREQINAFYEYRITDDHQLNDYITVRDPAQGQTGIDKSYMTIDYRMPTPEAPYDMRRSREIGRDYDFDKGVSIAQLRAISQRYPHTEASDLDPNSKGIDSLDFTVCIMSGSIAGAPTRHFSYQSGGPGYYTYIRVIDQRRRSLSLEPNISLVGYKYTPLNIPFASASRVEVRANGRPLNESKFSIRDKVNLSFNIQNDPNNMYHFYRIETKSGRLIYQYGETSLNGQSSNTVYQKLSTDFTVSGEDDVFLVTLCRWKSSFTVQSNDPSLGQAFFVDQENYPYSSVRGGGRNRLVLAEGEYFYPILKPSDNAIFRGWRIGNSDKILTTIGDLTPYFTIGTQNFVEKENEYLWTLLNPNNEDVVDLSLTAVFERKALAKATLTVGVSAKESGSVSINGKTQTSITVDQGTEVILEAQANKGYVFSHWKNSEGTQVETTAKLNYKVEKDETLTAVFEAAVKPVKKSTLTVGVSAGGSGTVSINGETQTSITVDQGTTVVLEAQANEGYVFSHWKNSEGRQVETTAKLTYTVEKDETLIAVFDKNAPAKATLSVGVSPEKSGSVSINGETQTSITVEQGKEVSLEAQANKGYNFSHWKNSEGRQVGTTAKLIYKVEKDETLTAVFDKNAPAKATLSVGVSPEKSGSVLINGETQTSITVEQGKEVALEAQANKGYNFSHWKNSEGRQVGTTAKLTYKVEKYETLTAVFDKNAPAKATLSVGVSPEKSGSVSINGETQTSITVEQGKEVSLEAQANKGYNFSHWKNSEGRQVGTTAKLTYKVEKDETLTAVFEAKITPRVDEVKVLTGQRDAILTWNAGSATSWQIKLYQAGQILGNPIVTQVPRVELGNLKPGQGYTYEISARSQGTLDSEAKKATFTTEKFNEAEAITPYLKGFSQFRGGQAFDLIWMDVNPTEFVSETPIYRYYWQATPTSELVPLTPSGKQLTLDANRRGGRLIVKILSGNDQLYEIGYDLNQ